MVLLYSNGISFVRSASAKMKYKRKRYLSDPVDPFIENKRKKAMAKGFSFAMAFESCAST
jgi:hypothetical protein